MIVTSKLRIPHSTFRFDLIVVAAIILLTFLLYAPSLRYPFVWYDADDLVHALKHTPAELLAGVPNYPYYRPLIWLFWKLLLTLWADRAAPLMYAYLIGVHALNGVLLFALIRDLTRRRVAAVAAALLLITFPFNYQAITWATAQSHPTNLLLCLACLVIYVRARLKNKNWPYHLAAAVFLAAGMLVTEAAFINVGVVLLVEAYLIIGRRVPRLSKWPLLYIAVTAIMLIVYVSADKYGSPPSAAFDPRTGLYLLQSLIYPVSMLLARICQAETCAATAWLLPAAAVAVVVLLLLWWSGRTMLLGLFGLAWFGLAAAPIWLRLEYIYVDSGARLLYFAGAGVSIALAAILGDWQRERRTIVKAGRLALVALIIWIGGQFIVARQPLYDQAGQWLDQANAALFAPRNGTALFVNTIDLAAYPQAEFPLGWFGVFAAPWHNQVGATPHLRAENAEWVIDLQQAEDLRSHLGLAVEFHGLSLTREQFQKFLNTASDVYQFLPAGDQIHLFKIGAIQHGNAEPTTPLAEWGPVHLNSAVLETEAGTPILKLNWGITGPVDPLQTVFVHISDETGKIVAQADGDLISRLAPLSAWAPGDSVEERRPLPLPADLPPGVYTVALGLYNRQSLQRTLPTKTAQQPMEDGKLSAGRFTYPVH